MGAVQLKIARDQPVVARRSPCKPQDRCQEQCDTGNHSVSRCHPHRRHGPEWHSRLGSAGRRSCYAHRVSVHGRRARVHGQ